MATQPNWFVALAVPTASWWERLGAPPAGLRVFAPADVHVTVAFLGPCGRERAEAAFALAPSWPAGAVDATLGQVRPMGDPRRFSALAAVVERGAEALSAAILAVRAAMLEAAAARPDTRPPLPHATVARPARGATGRERAAALAWARAIDLGSPPLLLDRLVLYTWADDRRERLFREQAVLGLAAAPEARPGPASAGACGSRAPT